jgi:hypothetical protein
LLFFIWVKIDLLIKIISVNKDLARHSACRNDALAKSKSVAYSGCHKNVPFIERFFLQPLIPAFSISELIFKSGIKFGLT